MGDCPTCPAKRNVRFQRQYRSVPPRPIRNSVPPTEFYQPKPARYLPVQEAFYPRESYSPTYIPQNYESTYFHPTETDSGILHTLRNGFQKIFNGRKKPCEPLSKGKVYNYSTSQLRYMEQCLDKLEDEVCYIDVTIKEALDNNCRTDCCSLRYSLATITDQVEGMRCDLLCAYECYDPYRDKCEYDLICSLLDRTHALEGCLNDLCLQLECLESFSLYSGPCEINCQKPCCVKRPSCKPNCKKPCCYRPYRVPCERPCRVSDPCRVPCEPCRVPCEQPCRVSDPFRAACEPCRVSVPCDPFCPPFYPSPCSRQPYECRKPCCAKPTCAVDCRKPCCANPRRWSNGYNRPKPLCRTSSVIPVGVMLVKL